jgi:hypothetical protein
LIKLNPKGLARCHSPESANGIRTRGDTRRERHPRLTGHRCRRGHPRLAGHSRPAARHYPAHIGAVMELGEFPMKLCHFPLDPRMDFAAGWILARLCAKRVDSLVKFFDFFSRRTLNGDRSLHE